MVLMLGLDVTGGHRRGCRTDLTQKARKDRQMGLTENPQVDFEGFSVGCLAHCAEHYLLLLQVLGSLFHSPQAKGSWAQQP